MHRGDKHLPIVSSGTKHAGQPYLKMSVKENSYEIYSVHPLLRIKGFHNPRNLSEEPIL